jgi:putative copper resistance protein D
MPGPTTGFSWYHLNVWHLGALPILLMLAAGALYAALARRAGEWPPSRSRYFAAALIVTFLSTEWVIGAYDMELFSAHMVEHLLLIMVAAPLFALSAPVDLVRRGGGDRARRVLDSAPVRVMLHPLVGFGLYAVFIPATHLTGFFDVMLEHEWVHHGEQIGFLIVGYLFFRHAFGVEEGVQINPGLRLVYVMAAVPVDTFTGLALDMETRNPFHAYSQMSTGTPASILSNVHLGGAIMWIGGDALMLLALIPIAVTWVKSETVKTRELDAQLDAAGL